MPKKNPKSSLKTVGRRDPHLLSFRISHAELASLEAAIAQLKQDSSIELKPNAYAKHAVIMYAPLRRLEMHIRELHRTLAALPPGATSCCEFRDTLTVALEALR